MKLFDCFRKKPEPFLEGYQPHGAEAFIYLCPVCQRLDIQTEVCKDCKMECFPGFLPNVSVIKELQIEAFNSGAAIKAASKIQIEIQDMNDRMGRILKDTEERKKFQKWIAPEIKNLGGKKMYKMRFGREHFQELSDGLNAVYFSIQRVGEKMECVKCCYILADDGKKAPPFKPGDIVNVAYRVSPRYFIPKEGDDLTDTKQFPMQVNFVQLDFLQNCVDLSAWEDGLADIPIWKENPMVFFVDLKLLKKQEESSEQEE